MDDMERAVDDGINTFKSLTKDGRFVPGAGATEIELAKQLSSHAEVRGGKEGEREGGREGRREGEGREGRKEGRKEEGR